MNDSSLRRLLQHLWDRLSGTAAPQPPTAPATPAPAQPSPVFSPPDAAHSLPADPPVAVTVAPVQRAAPDGDADPGAAAIVFEAEPAPPPPARPEAALKDDGPGDIVRGAFLHGAGSRDYLLYLPPGWERASLPLVVMLHGCQQDADDFARGTRMNEAARRAGVLVLYPVQSQLANPGRCWNWFSPQHQSRDGGEPALLAALVEQIAEAHRVDTRRIYVAGLSAGGAMSAVLAQTHPELFAAIGVHSGLAFGVATDVMAALGAMKHGPSVFQNAQPPDLPTIVFHGDEDTTVHPVNGERVAALGADDGEVERAQASGGRDYTRRFKADTEHWLVHGAGHAWSGGHPDGSFTDPAGPDASAEMLRFFLAHPKRAVS